MTSRGVRKYCEVWWTPELECERSCLDVLRQTYAISALEKRFVADDALSMNM